ncbi:hypothetical protein NW755_009032 [Fusarium falciforme]|uniref:Uncharacterized protein n=1 Tax=Fusarium falciforme TaxID=195108 RepID=A0A9W8R0Y5_9HYPO|nr:hypothetical protein NW755_009032 [Fusarium falciforme]
MLGSRVSAFGDLSNVRHRHISSHRTLTESIFSKQLGPLFDRLPQRELPAHGDQGPQTVPTGIMATTLPCQNNLRPDRPTHCRRGTSQLRRGSVADRRRLIMDHQPISDFPPAGQARKAF